MEACIFCKIVKGEIPCSKVYEDDATLAFLDINPVTEGHTLVIPKHHSENLYEVPLEDLASVHRATQIVVRAIRNALDPIGVALVQLNGRGVNQIIMHYHVHLIPRSADDPELVVSDMGAKEMDQEALSRTAKKIADAIR